MTMTQKLTPNDFSAYIRRNARLQSLSLSQLAQRSQISRQTLYKIMEGDTEAKISTIIRLSAILQVHPLDMMRAFFGTQHLPLDTSPKSKYASDASSFIEDITIPDNMRVWVNQTFTKIWKIHNTGNMAWIKRRLICADPKLHFHVTDEVSGEFAPPASERRLIPAQDSVPIPDTQPGQTVQLSVEFTAPPYPGTQISYWKIVDEAGEICFPELEGLSCLVQVIAI